MKPIRLTLCMSLVENRFYFLWMIIQMNNNIKFATVLILIFTLIVVTLLPSGKLPAVSLSSYLQHYFVYMFITFVVMVLYNCSLKGIFYCFLIAVFSGVLEVLQIFSKGREPSLTDFAINLAGIFSAFGLAYVLGWVMSKKRSKHQL